MKVSGTCSVVLFLAGIALIFLFFSSGGGTNLAIVPGVTFTGSKTVAVTVTIRKLMESSSNPITEKNGNAAGTVNLEDYRPIDPVPSSKASIKPGPIEHGTPLNPFIPKPPPPSPIRSKNGV